LFSQHEETQIHQAQCRKLQGKEQHKINVIVNADLSHEAIWTRIQSVWWLAKQDIAITKFESLLEARLVDQGLQPPKSYRDDRIAWEIVEILGAHFREMLRERLQRSPFYGIMADETTDNSVEQQLVIYVKFLDKVDGEYVTTVEYLDLVTPNSGSAEDIKVF
jgi:hypothetical protein